MNTDVSTPADPADELLEDLVNKSEDDETDTSPSPEVRHHTLHALIDEHRQHRIHHLWLAETRAVAGRIARNYPPHRYGAGAAWDSHAIDDLCQDIVVRLLRKSQIEYICDTANDLPHARALLRRQVRLTLIDRLRHTAVSNLVTRALNRLATAPFERLDIEPVAWALAHHDAPTATTPRDRTDFVQLSQRLRSLPRVRHSGLERATPIWSAETLLEALTDIVVTFGVVTRSELEEIFANALTSLNVAEFVDDVAGDQSASSELGPEVDAMVNQIATRAVGSLTDEESAVLAHKFRGLTDHEIAEEVGRSRPTVATRRGTGAEKIRDAIIDLDQDTQNAVLVRFQWQVLEANK